MHTDTSPTVLITGGGAGFIGSHLATELLQHGYQVRILDNLMPQVHGSERRRPEHLDRRAEVLVGGDIRDAQQLKELSTGGSMPSFTWRRSSGGSGRACTRSRST